MSNPFYLLLALGLVGLNAFFVATEFAIVKVRVTRIEELVSRGASRAAAVKMVLEDLNAYLSACQLGITLASLGLGWVGEPAFAHFIEPLFAGLGAAQSAAAHSVALTLSFVLITFLHVVLGEQVPKTLAIERAEGTTLLVVWPIRLFHLVFYPFTWFLNATSNLAVRLMGLPPVRASALAHSEEELRMILALSRKSGQLSESQARLLTRVLDFPERSVRQIMVPRADIAYLDARRPYAENLASARTRGHTRYPLCDGDLDRVVGIVHIKDLFLAPPEETGVFDLRRVAREPLFVPESAPLERLLSLFQKERVHLGVVIDEYGGTSGIVALEDVLEELTGEIQDEFDEEAPKVLELGDGRLSVDATLPLDELEHHLGIRERTEEEVDTLGGLVLAKLGRIARVGDEVKVGGRRVEVVRIRGRRILRLTVHPLAPRVPKESPRVGGA